tara:strand:+ start:826 stop:1206 length:381 start_codon:yes stop_codon:yes gene_type:complete
MPSHIIPITPVSKPRMTQRDRWKERPVVKRYRDFCDELRLKLPKQLRLPDLADKIQTIDIQFFLPMAKTWSKKKKIAMDGQPHQQKPDIDNLLKAWMDALYRNDAVIWKVSASKMWSLKGSIVVEL